MTDDKVVNFYFSLYFCQSRNDIFNKINTFFVENKLYDTLSSELGSMLRNLEKCLAINFLLKLRTSRLFNFNNYIINYFKPIFTEKKWIKSIKKAEIKATEFGIIDDSKMYDISFLTNKQTKWKKISSKKDEKEKRENALLFDLLMGFSNYSKNDSIEPKKKSKSLKMNNLIIDDSLDEMFSKFQDIINKLNESDIDNKNKECLVAIFLVSDYEPLKEHFENYCFVKLLREKQEKRFDKIYNIGGIKVKLIYNIHLHKNKAEIIMKQILDPFKTKMKLIGCIKDLYQVDPYKLIDCLKSF